MLEIGRAARPRPRQQVPARRRRHPHRPWLTQRPAPARRVARVRASAWSPARETRPPRPDRHVPAPDRLSAPARRRRPHRVRRPPAAGATRGGRDRVRIGHVGQRSVHRCRSLRRRRPVCRRTGQRMPEAHPSAELASPSSIAGVGRVGADAEPCGRSPDQRRIAGRLGGGDQQQSAGLLGQDRQGGAGSFPRCARKALAHWASQIRRPARGRSDPRGSSSSASGLPRVSATN